MKENTSTDSLPGAILREARRSRGLSLQYIANELRLTVQIIEAMEGDDYQRLPANIFVQGYIRNYAHLIGLDPAPLLKQYAKLANKQAVPSQFGSAMTSINRNKPRKQQDPVLPVKALSYAVVVTLVSIALVIIYNHNASNSVETTSNKSKYVAVDRAKLSSGEFVVSGVRMQNEQNGEKPATKVTNVTPKPAEKNPPNVDVLSIKFIQDTYIKVVDADNRALLSHIGKRGFRDKVLGKAPFKIILTRPEHVEVELNGKLYKPSKVKISQGNQVILVKDD